MTEEEGLEELYQLFQALFSLLLPRTYPIIIDIPLTQRSPFPMKKGEEPTIQIKMDGKLFTLFIREARGREWVSGENYLYTARIQSYSDRKPLIITEAVRSSDVMEVYNEVERPFFRLTSTNGQWKVLPKGQTSIQGVFLENMTDNDFDGDIRLALEDQNGRVVQQGTYWTHFPIDSYSYDGLRLPFLANAPVGEYRLQVYLRRAGDTKWFVPSLMDDISVYPKDRIVRVVDDYPNVRFAKAYWRVQRTTMGRSTKASSLRCN